MEYWVEIRKSGNFAEIGKRTGVSPVIARLLCNRGISEEEYGSYLHGTTNDLGNPHLLKDMDRAAGILAEGIKAEKHIRIIGDYDIDGVCSAYILETAIRNVYSHIAGADRAHMADAVLPHRIIDGYGMNRRLIDEAADDGVGIIITCDNGISALEEIAYAKERGLEVIVTDHHEVPFHMDGDRKIYEIPAADAVVNPKQRDCTYPFKEMCGAAVAYRLSQVLYELTGYPGDREEFLDMAAFATIGDVMPLCGENRIIVKEGLEKIKHTKNVGLRALIDACDLSNRNISAYHVGFVLGPCMNAAGRLDTAVRALDLLREGDAKRADKRAGELKMLNDERKDLTARYTKEACEKIDEMDHIPDVIVSYLPECHESIAGIIAGRIREKYNHPAFVLTRTEGGLKGSGRSIETYDMHLGLLSNRDLFSKFGGHKMAAGLSISAKDDEERDRMAIEMGRRLNESSSLEEEDFRQKVEIDLELPFSYISEELIGQIALLEPCGMGNRKPLFAARHVKVSGARLMGKEMDMLKGMAADSSGRSMQLIIFRDGKRAKEILDEKGELTITYYPDINEFRGERSLVVTVKNFK